MHLKSKINKEFINNSCNSNTNMASSLLNDDEDNATRNTQQQQQHQHQQHQAHQQSNNNNNLNDSSSNQTNATSNTLNSNKMQDNEANKLKKQNLEQRKQELEKLLNEKSWLLQQLQKQETQILNGNVEYLNFNDFIQNLAVQYKHEQTASITALGSGDGISTLSGSGLSNHLSTGEEAILRRKPLTAKENHQHLNNNNVLHRRQSEISNRSSEYDNYPQNDNQSTHSEGGRGAVIMHGAAQATQQYAAKAALKKRSATVAGTTAQSSSNLQMIRQQHLEQQQQQLLYKQQQQQHQQQLQQHYHHPQQHLFKQHLDHHPVLVPHLQYATQKFYYTTLQPQVNSSVQQLQQQHQQQQQQQQHHQQQLQHQQAQQQYGRYIQNKQIAQQQTSAHHAQHHLLLTPPSSSGSAITVDNISLYSLNSNNVATLHRAAQQQQPIIVQCDKYYLSPTSHHVNHNDGGGFIKSSQNIKEYISPHNSPQHISHRDKNRLQQASQSNLTQRGATPALDIISLAPSYVSMETIDYSTSPVAASNMRWRSQTNLPPMPTTSQAGELKSQSSDMLNNNLYYNTALNPPPPPPPQLQSQTLVPPPNVTQVKPFKPLDEVSINSYSTETQKKVKPKQWLESSLDGPVIRQTPLHDDPSTSSSSFTSNHNNNSTQPRAKLSSQSLNTARHYSMSAAQTKSNQNQNNSSANTPNSKLSQSTSYLNQMDNNNPTPTPSISQAYNLELSPQIPTAYKYFPVQQKLAPARPPPSALYVNTSHTNATNTPTPPMAAALSPDIRIESPVNMTVVQPATFQPYKEVTKPFEMSDFYKYSTKFRQKENNNNNNNASLD